MAGVNGVIVNLIAIEGEKNPNIEIIGRLCEYTGGEI